MALCSCSGSSDVSGRYSFSMGKQSGAHFGVALELGKLPTDPEEKPSLKMEFDIGIEEEYLKTLLKYCLHYDEEKDIYYLTGTYEKITREPSDPKYEPTLGIELDVAIDLKEGAEIPKEAVKMLMDCYVKDSTASVIIPVSFDDIKCKLFWEGVDLFHPLEPVDVKTLISDPQNMGVHPTEDQVIEIKASVNEFRDWHTVSIGMLKEK